MLPISKMEIHNLVNPNKQQKNCQFNRGIHIQNTILKKKNKLQKIFQNPINKINKKIIIKVNLNPYI